MDKSKVHIRHCILYEFQQGKSASAACKSICETLGDNIVSIATVKRWFARFKDGDFDLEDKERTGAPRKAEDDEIQALLDEDPCQTQQQLADQLGITQQEVSIRLRAMGKIQKYGKWVPHKLTEAQKNRRIDICHSFLVQHQRKSFLWKIVTGDEKWIYYENPKRKKAYVDPGQPGPSQPKRGTHSSKVMLCIWWDIKGVLYYELLEPNQTVNKELYQRQLLKLSEELGRKRPYSGHGKRPVKLLHDNARPHVANLVRETLTTLGWEVLPHPAYSPDLAPTDYHLNRSIDNALKGKYFRSFEEVQKWVDKFIQSKDPQFFSDGIHQLPQKWQQALNSNGDYFD